ncbi:MAG: hypothetical protein HY200_00565 [Nitrospirae bacterium]|nr:hypothetical protein [Nitrospirota bacterium]MBI3593430.1 hypothetical protein [Nitrospirota bacterium]
MKDKDNFATKPAAVSRGIVSLHIQKGLNTRDRSLIMKIYFIGTFSMWETLLFHLIRQALG